MASGLEGGAWGKVSTLVCLKYGVCEAGGKGDKVVRGQIMEGL